jgi:hypothetical protein
MTISEKAVFNAVLNTIKWWKVTPETNLPMIKKNLMRKFTKDEITIFSAGLYSRLSQIGEALTSEQKENIWSDDGWSDTKYHIAGKTEQEFEDYLKNPERIIKVYDDMSYVESLSYVIPCSSDWALVDVSYWTKEVADYVNGPQNSDLLRISADLCVGEYEAICRIEELLAEGSFYQAIEIFQTVFSSSSPKAFSRSRTKYMLPNLLTDMAIWIFDWSLNFKGQGYMDFSLEETKKEKTMEESVPKITKSDVRLKAYRLMQIKQTEEALKEEKAKITEELLKAGVNEYFLEEEKKVVLSKGKAQTSIDVTTLSENVPMRTFLNMVSVSETALKKAVEDEDEARKLIALTKRTHGFGSPTVTVSKMTKAELKEMKG